MTTDSITRSLARFVSNVSYKSLPATVTDTAKRLLLDSLGNAIAGRRMHTADLALKMVRGKTGNSTVLTYELKVPLMDAAFVNAVLIDATSQEDCLFSTHPGSVILPTAIAVSEQEGRSGSELLAALVAGYEIIGRVYLGAPEITLKFRGTPIFGVFGAAATAGKLLGLSEDQLTTALGYAANFASGLNECWIAGTMEGHLHAGVAAMSGILAANLAKAGASAAERTLEGSWGFYQAFGQNSGETHNATIDLGKRYLILEVSYKPYPVCGGQQIPISNLLKLKSQYNINAQDINQIMEKVPARELGIPGSDNPGPFANAPQTLLSGQFCAAATLLGKPIWSPEFYEIEYRDAEILALAQKVKLIGEKDRKIPEITITLKNGQTFRIEEGKEKGTLAASDQNIRAKFNSLTLGILGQPRSSEFIDFVMSLEKVDDLRDLTRRMLP